MPNVAAHMSTYRAGDACLHARLIASLPSFKKEREKERKEMTEGVDGHGYSLRPGLNLFLIFNSNNKLHRRMRH